jgi:hypothetical protein
VLKSLAIEALIVYKEYERESIDMQRKKSKQLLVVAIVLAMLVAASLPAYAAGGVTVYVNGKQLVADVPAVITDGRTMLPFRAVFNALGVSDDRIVWNEKSKTVEVNRGVRGATYIFLCIGGTGAVVGDEMIMLDVAPYISNSRTLVPLRFVAESLGADVDWNPNTKVVTVTK